MLCGPANESSPHRSARDGTRASNNPQGGATSTKPHDPRMLTVGRAFDATTGDGRTRDVGSMRELTTANLQAARAAARESPFVRPERRHDADAPEGRSSQMFRFFARCRDRDRNTGAWAEAARNPTRAKWPDLGRRAKRRNLPGRKMIRSLSSSARITIGAHPRAARDGPMIIPDASGAVRRVQRLVGRPCSALQLRYESSLRVAARAS